MTVIPAMQLGPNHKYCPNCATVLDVGAPVCARCSAPQAVPAGYVSGKPKSKVAAALLAFFLGGFGVHRFYLGQWGWGLLFLLFFWTGIPGIAAFVDFIRYLVMAEDEFQRRYAGNGGGAVIAIVAGVAVMAVFVVGILAAIAIPNFLRYQLRARDQVTRAQLASLDQAQQAKFGVDGVFVEPPGDSFPAGGELGNEALRWSAEEQQFARELGLTLEPATHARFSMAVGELPGVASYCAETDLDGDGLNAAWVLFRPSLDAEDPEEAAPPPAPCSDAVVLDEENGATLEWADHYQTGEPIRLSPDGVW